MRAGIAKALAPLAADPAILAALRPFLEDPDDMVRRDATEALGPACGDSTVRKLVGGMLADPDELMPISVLAALENVPLDPSLVAPIGELTYSRDRGVAESAYSILCRWRDQEVVC